MSKIIIVGGVAGGATAATRLRRLGEDHQIIMFERDEFVSFANCGLPYYIGGVIKDRQRLLVESVEGLKNKFNIDVRNFSEVLSIDRSKKTVLVKKTQTGETYEESYDKLILSPGAKPIVVPTKGLETAKNIFVLRNIPDTDRIKDFIIKNQPHTAVVIGGGFIGIEMAENLVGTGVKVTVVDLADQILAPLDFEMAKLAQNEMADHGVRFYLSDVVSEFSDEGKTLTLKSGTVLKADMVIMGIGVKPESDLALKAGLKVGPRGHILTTPTMQTLDAADGALVEDVYAIGDAVEVQDYVDGTKTAIALAWPANRQGRLVADHIAGKPIHYTGSLGSSIVKVFDLTIASTGNNEKTLKRKNVPYKFIYINRGSHAGYYPGAQDIFIKLLFTPEGKILGAQGVGGEGVDKRIDVLATAIRGNLTVYDLPDIQLCYAPPFSSAKDPVNIAGYVATNVLEGAFEYVRYDQIDDILKGGAVVIDPRTSLEYGLFHLEGAKNIPLAELRQRQGELPADKNAPVYVYCNVGHTAYLAIQVLRNFGYTKLFNLAGGVKLYKAIKLYKPHVDEIPMGNPEQREVQPMIQDDKIQTKISIDACGMQCPGPIMQTFKAVCSLENGERVQVEATDPGFARDIVKWCENTGNTLVKNEKDGIIYRAVVEKGARPGAGFKVQSSNENTTIVLFSGDMDKAMAAMIIGQGSAAMGKNVTVFCTFWGLNLLRRPKKVKVKKTFIEAMFGFMMPRGPKKMGISKMNFAGAGPKMMKGVMKKKNVPLLEQQLVNARAAGVKFIACTMSMDIMGIRKEEIIDGVEFAGVATYLAESDNAGVTLFI